MSGGSTSQKSQSQQTSAPVINQPGLDMLNANGQRAIGIANQPFQPYTGSMVAPLSGNQNAAINAAPYSLNAGAANFAGASQTAGDLSGYRPPTANTSFALPGLLGPAPQTGAASYNPSQLGPAPQSGAVNWNASQLGPAPQASAGLTGPASTAGMIDRGSIGNVSTGDLLPGIAKYQSPYEDDVVQRTLNDLGLARQRQQVQDNQTATAQGAFGGNRQGVQDSLTNEAYLRQAGDTAANLRQAGFNTASGLAQSDASRALAAAQGNQAADLSVAGTNAGIGTFNAGQQNQVGMFNAGNQQRTNELNTNNILDFLKTDAAAQNAAGAFNAANQQQNNQFNTGNILDFLKTNAAAANQAGAFNAGNQQQANIFNTGNILDFLKTNAANTQQTNLTNAGAANDMNRFNVSSDLSGAGVRQNAANTLLSTGNAQHGTYQDYLNNLLGAGQVQQQNAQAQADAQYQEFLRQLNLPYMNQQLINQSLGLLGSTSLGQNSQGTSSGSASGWNFSIPVPGTQKG